MVDKEAIKKVAVKDMGEPKLKIIAMPSNTNPAGNIFGGWIMSQMDLAGGIAARELATEGVVTVAMDKVVFKEPVFVGDVLCCYAKIIEVGNSSVVVQVEVVVNRMSKDGSTQHILASSAILTFVSASKEGRKKPIENELKKLHGF